MTQNVLESSEAPAPAGLSTVTRFFIERSAFWVCEKGPEYEKKIMAKSEGNPDFSFMWSSDPNHEYYQQKISEHKQQRQQQQKQDEGDAPPDLQGGECKGDAPPPPKALELPKSTGMSPELAEWLKDVPPLPPAKHIVKLYRGVTRKEIYTIKLTAQFVARHGVDFERSLMDMEDSRFEFMKPTHSMFSYFKRLAAAYSAKFRNTSTVKVLKACSTAGTVVEDFFPSLESGFRDQEEMLEMEIQKLGYVKIREESLHKEGRELALIDMTEFLSKLDPLPEPKRRKFDDEPALVPEDDQFLAQHPVTDDVSSYTL